MDLVQESLLKALLQRKRFQEGTDLKAWIRTLARNTFINQYRRGRLGRRLEGDLELNRGDVMRAASSDDPLGQLEGKELLGEVAGLPIEVRAPFLLHCEGYKYKEIAQRMGIPIGTVKSRIHQARHALGRKYETV